MFEYIVPCYELLHTEGKAYIVREVVDIMREKRMICISWLLMCD